MEARFESEAQGLYGLSSIDLRPVGQRSLEWDLNDWKWDGDLFIARQLNPMPIATVGQQFFPVAGNSSNSSSSCSDEGNMEIEKRQELERKRRVVLIEDDNLKDDAGSLTLKLGGHGDPASERGIVNYEGSAGKKTKLGSGATNRAVCQVEGCGADLSNVKDYHRRHKVCEAHSKASSALVGGLMQRFCQQCSRFHNLQEFDEGKRSCRRRLAGHNKRRRKTNPDANGNVNPLNDDHTSSYLLISLLKILSNMHSNRSDHTTDQDLLNHLLKSLANNAGEHGGKNVSGLLQGSQGLLNGGTTALPPNEQGQASKHMTTDVSEMPRQEVRNSSAGQVKMNKFDLNDIYVDSDDTEDTERSPPPTNLATSSMDYPSWLRQDSRQSSPPQTSRNSDSSDQSPSSSSGEAQSRTDRIVFKLFGKEPNDFPVILRTQILEWLSHSPTDMESYIRPGCIILTIYLRQDEAAWEELCSDLGFSLSRLLALSDDNFWTTGWIYVRARHQIAFACNGEVVVDKPLPLKSNTYSKILYVKPIAVPASKRAEFSIRGVNLSRPGTRVLCALGGRYLVQELTTELTDAGHDSKEHGEIQCVNFPCSVPSEAGRGFLEIEDQGLSSSYFPFIVADDDVCSEIRMLESVLECIETDGKGGTRKTEAVNEAMGFIHEIGWLLSRSQVRTRLGNSDPNSDLFPLRRFRWLIEFSMDHEWCAVVNKLLNILFDGVVGAGEHDSIDLALSEMCLLHRAVRKNSRPMVELLVRYAPKQRSALEEGHCSFLFKPDTAGPGGLTPLHIAAGKDGSEDVLDALTEDPGMVGLEAWKNSHDSNGFTPIDYARLRGHYSYIHLVQRKLNKKPAAEHVVIEIPSSLSDPTTNQKQNAAMTSNFEISQAAQGSLPRQCKLCDRKLIYGTSHRSMVYRPAMLSMLAVAAVCVCVALLFKSSPEVLNVFRPFRWELLDYGPI